MDLNLHVPRALALERDARDPLAGLRDQFDLPDGTIYLDGNSLGALPRATAKRVEETIVREWGKGLIRSWNDAHWVDLAKRVGQGIAPMIGAQADEIIACDSTSINLFKVLSASLSIQSQRRPERTLIVSESGNFPTDLYIIDGLTNLLNGDGGSGYELLNLDHPGQLDDALRQAPAAVVLTHVDYRSGRMHNMAEVTRKVQEKGALMIWDLAHSAGAVPVDLNSAHADFAIGCGYKYLNGGPGAPAFLWVAKRHHTTARQPLSGWFGHRAPFDFDRHYQPATGIERYQCGTPSILALSALECGLRTHQAALSLGGMTALREKSMALTEWFIELVDLFSETWGLALASPRNVAERGSQVSYRANDKLKHGYAVMQALIKRGVIGDFRAPDILRFGFTPLYTRYVDAWDAAATLLDILETRHWDQPEFHRKASVT